MNEGELSRVQDFFYSVVINMIQLGLSQEQVLAQAKLYVEAYKAL